jgi:hypothetical protein
MVVMVTVMESYRTGRDYPEFQQNLKEQKDQKRMATEGAKEKEQQKNARYRQCSDGGMDRDSSYLVLK